MAKRRGNNGASGSGSASKPRKARKQKNQNGSRKGKQPPAYNTSMSKSAAGTATAMGLVPKVCSVLDPFCVHAKGGRLFDGMASGSFPIQSRGLFTIATTAGGNAVYYVYGSYPYNVLTTNGAGTTAATFSTLGVNTSVTAVLSEYRIVSWGVIIRNILPATTAAGSVVVSLLPAGPPLNSVVGLSSVTGIQSNVYSLHPNFECSVIPRVVGNEAREFITASTNANAHDNGWQVIKIELIGAAASNTPIHVECFYNLEGRLLETQAFLTQAIAPKSVSNPIIDRLYNKALDKAGTIIEGGVDMVGKKLASAAAGAVAGMIFKSPSAGMATYAIADEILEAN